MGFFRILDASKVFKIGSISGCAALFPLVSFGASLNIFSLPDQTTVDTRKVIPVSAVIENTSSTETYELRSTGGGLSFGNLIETDTLFNIDFGRNRPYIFDSIRPDDTLVTNLTLTLPPGASEVVNMGFLIPRAGIITPGSYSGGEFSFKLEVNGASKQDFFSSNSINVNVTEVFQVDGSSSQAANVFNGFSEFLSQAENRNSTVLGRVNDCANDLQNCDFEATNAQAKAELQETLDTARDTTGEALEFGFQASPIPTPPDNVVECLFFCVDFIKEATSFLTLISDINNFNDPIINNVEIDGEYGSFQINPIFDVAEFTLSFDISEGLYTTDMIGLEFSSLLPLLGNSNALGFGRVVDVQQGPQGFNRVTLEARQLESSSEFVAAVPLPASGLMLLFSFGLLVLASKRSKA